MSTITSYLFLVLAVALGTASNGFAKSAAGFTLWIPSIITAITIVLCMYALSHVMKVIPVGVTYASFAGLTIIATTVVGVFKFILKNQGTDTLATKVPLEGDLKNVKTGVLPTVFNIFENAWINAFKNSVNEEINFEDAKQKK